ncbi:DUF882 domain-containing protein [Xanthobacter autotrophicus DSM 431]
MRRRCLPVLRIAAVGTSLLVAGTSSLQNAVANGDTRTLTFHHTHSGEDGTFTFKKNGRYDPEALAKINHFLRDWRNQKATQMDPALFDIVWEVYREVNASAPIQIVSSYRSPETNSMLRSRSSGVAKFSQHMLGKAMDFYIPGVSLTDLRVAGLRLQRGGVGFYPTSGSPFVHMDTGNVRHWPRMSHDQLARVFPDGKTVHVPSDGRPLSGYNTALAEIQARGSRPGVQMASAGGKTLFSRLFGKKDADDEESGGEATTVAAAQPATDPAPAEQTAPARGAPARPLVAALAPLPPNRPAELAAGAMLARTATSVLPIPVPRRPAEADAGRARQVASMMADDAPLPPIITRGTDAEDAPALGYAAAPASARFLAGGLMAHVPNASGEMAQPASGQPPAGRGRSSKAAEPKPAPVRTADLSYGRMLMAPRLSAQSYLRTPEVRSLADLMEPAHSATAFAMGGGLFFVDRPGDAGRGGKPPVALTQRM